MNRPPRYCRQKGVTLIEMIMVIVVLALAAGSSLILFDRQWVARRGAAAATNEVANSLINARNTAIANQATVAVRRVRTRSGEQLLITEFAGPLRDRQDRVVELGSDVTLRGGPQQILFEPTGGANRGLRWTIVQSRSSGRVTVARVRGLVRRTLP